MKSKEKIEVKEHEVKEQEVIEPRRKQKVSLSYTIRAFGNHVQKMKDAGLINHEELKVLEEIKKKALNEYIRQSF